MQYSHTQRATVIIAVIALVAVLLVVQIVLLLIFSEDPLGPLLSAGLIVLLAIAVYLFKSMTVVVDDTTLAWYFGPRFLRRSVALEDIASAEAVRSPLYGGWGIHWTARGWLYNVSGRDAVEVQLKSGRRFLLGTDEPEDLISVLTSRIEGRSVPA